MKGNCHQCRIIRFPKISILKIFFGSSVDDDVADKPCLSLSLSLSLYIYIYDVSGLTVVDLKYFSLCYLASFEIRKKYLVCILCVRTVECT